jgi:hypothetical protein
MEAIMRTQALSRLLAALLLLAAALPAAAKDFYVKAGAAGKGSSPADPLDEVWKALEKATRGDVIRVARGSYNGKAGSGHFVIKVPNLSLVGGYNDDFSARAPFVNLTVLERAKDFKGDWTGLPEAIVAGDQREDHSGFVLDGFVLNAESRNSYVDDVVALKAPTYAGPCFQTYSANVKIRNCILLNPVGDGIYCTWQGTENEVFNNFIVNTFYSAIETRSAQPDSRILIKNNTIAYGWSYPTRGGAIGVFVGRLGATVMDSNVFAFLQTEAEEDGMGVKNTFGNDATEMTNNVFFSCTGGFYKYMDANKQSLIAWKAKDLDELNDEDLAGDYMLAASGGNREADPGLKPDKAFATKFANFVASVPGKLNMDAMNEWRRSLGLPLQADPGSARKNYGFAYPLAAVVPGLVSSIPGVGARPDAPLAVYESAAAAPSVSYAATELKLLKKGQVGAKGEAGRALEFKAGVGDVKTVYEIEAAPRNDYLCVQLLLPGASGTATMDFVYGYILKGSPANKVWDDWYKKKDKTWKDGVLMKGRAFDFAKQSYNYPVGIVVDEISKK